MTTVRIAHFSDTHVLALKGVGPGKFLNKRWTGAVNLALNRSRHYRVEIFERLLDAVKATAPDHSVCTGDLVNLALQPEFDRVGQLLGDRFASHELTIVPGNHDYYVKDAIDARLFEETFGRWQPVEVDIGQGAYPVVRQLGDVVIIGINSAIETPVFMANGAVGEGQLESLSTLLEHTSLQKKFRLLLIHHPLLPEPKRRLDSTRRLNDADDLITLLTAERQSRVDLVVHGHNHEFKRMTVPFSDIPLIQVASASRAGEKHRAEFNVYRIEDGALAGIERHIHDPNSGEFIQCDESGSVPH